jgi:hypothetical protein
MQVEQLHRCSQHVAPATKKKLNEEKSKHIGLAQQNGFWAPTFFHKMMLRLVKHTTKP